jgi:hypothetical protein
MLLSRHLCEEPVLIPRTNVHQWAVYHDHLAAIDSVPGDFHRYGRSTEIGL